MLVKKIKYIDYNGEQREEDFMFNLSKAELQELLHDEEGALDSILSRIIMTRDNHRLVQEFKRIILMSYGVKSDDGKRFIKSEKLRTEFSQTEAYVELFMELSTNAEAAVEFVNGIIPRHMADAIAEQNAVNNGTTHNAI